MNKEKTKILLNIETELKEKIGILAEKDGRSTTNMINHILKQYIDKEKENDRKTIS